MSQTLRQEILAARKILEIAGIEDAAFNVDQMVAEIFNVSAGCLPAMWNNAVDISFHNRLAAMIERRCRHEPLQYIIENWSFLDFDVVVRPGSLIPRPETEEVFVAAEKAVKKFHLPEKFSFIDVCTGTGILGIAIARKFSEANGWLADISEDALKTASVNLAKQGRITGRLKILRSDLLQAFADESVEMVISNPPYIESCEMNCLMPEVRDFEPHLALDGGVDGLQIILRLLQQAERVLKIGGILVFEHGHGQRSAIIKLIDSEAWELIEAGDDLQGRERYIILIRR